MTKTTKNHNDENVAPTALAALQKFDALSAVMSETALSIPKALASERESAHQLGLGETAGDNVDALRKQLDGAISARQSDARRRASACEGLLGLEADLNHARSVVDQARSELATGVIREFTERWNEACARLMALRSESESLTRVLGVPVRVAPPFTTKIGLNGLPELKAVTPAEPAPVSLPRELTGIADTLARLDGALGLCAALRQGRELTERHFALSRLRAGMQAEMLGLFEVTRGFSVLGSSFEKGALIDHTVLPHGLLHRFWTGRQVRPLETAVAA